MQLFFLELFKPGKLNVDARYKPEETIKDDAIQDLKVKRKLKSMDEVMQNSNETKHRTYHVPPGLFNTVNPRNMRPRNLRPRNLRTPLLCG
jgi:hypothetical protein